MKEYFSPNTLKILMLVLVYILSAKIGLLLSFEQGYIRPALPPTGIALATILFFGIRFWPCIFIGSFLANVNFLLPLNLSIAVGNTLEAVIAGYIILRFASPLPFSKISETIIFILALLGSTMISASIGVGSLYFADITQQEDVLLLWEIRWAGGLVGGLIVTPFLLTWYKSTKESLTNSQLVEAIFMLFIILSIVAIVWGQWDISDAFKKLIKVSLLPIIAWSALRFHHHGATLTVMVITTVAIIGTKNGVGPFALADEGESLFALQAYIGVVVLTSLLLMASQEERQDAFRAVGLSKKNLENMVSSRTHDLNESNGLLKTEMQQQSHLADSLKMLLHYIDTPSSDEFVISCAKALTLTYKTQFSLIGTFADKEKNSIKTLAVWGNDSLIVNFTYKLKGTPCADALDHSMEFIPRHAAALYPDDKMLISMEIESYFGAPLKTTTGEIIGIIIVMDTKPLYVETALRSVLGLFSNKVALELQRRKVAKELELAASVFNESLEAIIVCDANTNIVRVNPEFTEITGYSLDEVIGEKPTLIKSGYHSKFFYKNLWTIINKQGFWKGEITNKRKNGEIFISWQIIKAVKDSNGQVQQYISLLSDITEKKKTDQQIYRLAHLDMITQLPNRFSFHKLLDNALILASKSSHRLAIMFIDLDHFKLINDTSGHLVGDELLQQVALRLKDVIGSSNVISRFGGDEFTVLLPCIKSTQDIENVANQILEALLSPFTLLSCEVTISASIGIGIFPDDAQDASNLFSCADNAMHSVKESGRSGFNFYTNQMKINAHERVIIERELRQALKLKQFSLNYQPQIDIKTGQVVGVEALLRWFHPSKGFISPGKFISIAEITGLIIPIGQWVIEEACRQLQRWIANGFDDLTMAINLSARQFFQKDLLDTIKNAVQESGVPVSKLEFEITESMMMNNIEETIETLHKVKRLGVQLSIDDFGTGYSSLSYLKRFPLNKLKIDKSFIDGLANDNDDLAIVQAIIGIAHSLHLTVIAEGVETADQFELLEKYNCNEIQGYYFSKPLQEEQATQFINNSLSSKCIKDIKK
jgi:diguanylate cyclase (GGDEF)-like protein/PAS domain S-box-containing protein